MKYYSSPSHSSPLRPTTDGCVVIFGFPPAVSVDWYLLWRHFRRWSVLPKEFHHIKYCHFEASKQTYIVNIIYSKLQIEIHTVSYRKVLGYFWSTWEGWKRIATPFCKLFNLRQSTVFWLMQLSKQIRWRYVSGFCALCWLVWKFVYWQASSGFVIIKFRVL